MYVWFQWDRLLTTLGLTTPCLLMKDGEDVLNRNPSCPCLFFFGANKGFNFHIKKWEAALARRSD